MTSFRWRCPFCSHHATITQQNYATGRLEFSHGNRYGFQALKTEVFICPNPECLEYAVRTTLHDHRSVQGAWTDLPEKRSWQLIPEAEIKPFPDYVPPAILADYREGCLTQSSSPKASATLSRRCLQGMIRDFWGIRKNRLVDEIDAIRDKVDPLTWKAIDSLRKIGNVGAHMESDINVIVEVDPGEAGLLIGLVETLIHEWYVVRHEREERLNKIISVSDAKQAQRVQRTSPSADPGT